MDYGRESFFTSATTNCLPVNLDPVRERIDDENFPTLTSSEQIKVEDTIDRFFQLFLMKSEIDPESPALYVKSHVSFLKQYLTHLPTSYECLDSSRPWLCYWITHSLVLLNETLADEDKSHVAQFLARCQCEDGGFGGGPGQAAHLAPTYAAVNALVSLGTDEAYKVIDRQKLYKFLWSVKVPNGAFQMHVGGEVDIRGVYCALAVARLTNIYTDALFDNSALWIISCQTYEGGFSGCPGLEAHGGYAFCALAALCLLAKEQLCNLRALLRWTVNRQMKFEGGFQGRTNKLVDGCYSFWQAGTLPLIHGILFKQEDSSVMKKMDEWLFQSRALQEYILICCQCTNGGLIDKPGKQRDLYHTCYTLSGLSVSQHVPGKDVQVVGSYKNLLMPLHPMYNIGIEKLKDALLYFNQLPVPNYKTIFTMKLSPFGYHDNDDASDDSNKNTEKITLLNDN
ncbi:farnesyl transferase beta subunit [Lycorma delicatula]|uniref:farnesyl transferase beta subunit n=1 Tax=Lycorma delicatula TaxID=130591 RepID=UPI003F510773